MGKELTNPFLSVFISSESGVKEHRDDLSGAETDVVAVASLLAASDALSELTVGVDHSTSDTGCKNNVLLVVVVVRKSDKLLGQVRHIAVSVDDVGGLGKTDIGKRELGDLSGVIDVQVVEESESGTDGLGKTRSAGIVEATSGTVDATEEHLLVVERALTGGLAFLTIFGLAVVADDFDLLTLVSGSGTITLGGVVLSDETALHANGAGVVTVDAVGGHASSVKVGSGSALVLGSLVVESVHVDTAL